MFLTLYVRPKYLRCLDEKRKKKLLQTVALDFLVLRKHLSQPLTRRFMIIYSLLAFYLIVSVASATGVLGGIFLLFFFIRGHALTCVDDTLTAVLDIIEAFDRAWHKSSLFKLHHLCVLISSLV